MSIIQTIRDTIVKDSRDGFWKQIAKDEQNAAYHRQIFDEEITPEMWYGVASGQNTIYNDKNGTDPVYFKRFKDNDGDEIEFETSPYDFDGALFDGAEIDKEDVNFLLNGNNRVFKASLIDDAITDPGGNGGQIFRYVWGVTSNVQEATYLNSIGIMDILEDEEYAQKLVSAGVGSDREIIEVFLKELSKLENDHSNINFLSIWSSQITFIKKNLIATTRDVATMIDGVQPGFYSFDTFVKKISIATSFILEYGEFTEVVNGSKDFKALAETYYLDELDMLLKNYTDGTGGNSSLKIESTIGSSECNGSVRYRAEEVWKAKVSAQRVIAGDAVDFLQSQKNDWVTNLSKDSPQFKEIGNFADLDSEDQKIINFLKGDANFKSTIQTNNQRWVIVGDPELVISNKVNGEPKNVLTYETGIPLFLDKNRKIQYAVEEDLLEAYYQFAIDLKTGNLPTLTVGGKTYFNLTKVMDAEAFNQADNISETVVSNRINDLKARLFIKLKELIQTPDNSSIIDEIIKDQAKDINNGVNLGYEEDEISKKEIAERQKLLEQCALLLNLKGLATNYNQKNKLELGDSGKIHESGYFGNRFLRVQRSNSSKTLTSLYSQKASAKPFLEITPVLQGLLVPKIKIQKILHRPGVIETIDVPFTGITTEREFGDYPAYPELQPIDYQEAIKNRTIFRGGGVGIKSISFDFDGETPATAQKWVRSTMSLKFQDFGDLVAQRDTYMSVSTNPSAKQQTKFRFLDLIVNSTSDNLVEDGVDAFFREFYKPVDYKIKIDVGWNYQDTPATRNIITSQGIDPDDFFEAIDKQNKSFLFSALDHDINIADDGSIDLNINYFGYPDALLSSYKFNALVTQQQEKELKDELDNLRDLIKDGKCTKSQLAKLTAAIEQRRLEVTKQSSRSIQGRLVKYGLLRSITVTDQSQLRTFKQSGTFTHVPTIETSLDSGFSARAGQTKKFFFLGDLLYVLMDCLYEQNGTRVQGTENVSIILTDFEFNEHLPYSGGTPPSTKTVQVNLASIPISLDFFKEWFTEEILASERYNYPLMDFILILANRLMGDILTEVCYNKEYDKTLFFRQAQMFGSKLQNFMLNYITNRVPTKVPAGSSNFGIVNVNHPYVADNLPLSYTGTGGAHDMCTFVAIYPDLKPLTHKGKGIYSDDLDQGIYHFHIGAASGLMKKVNFSKTNITYLRESRMMRYRGLGDFAQLSNVYNVSMDLYGNFLFFPGMQIYVDPFGIGGDEFGSPPKKLIDNDVMNYAKLMGIGGYHLITSVKTTIGVEGFKTSIEARFFFSGDEDGNDDTLDGLITKQQEPNSLANAGVGDGTNSAACGEIISVFETNTIKGSN